MAITAQTPYTNHMGNGTTTIFAYTFTIFDESDMAVYVDGILQTLTTDYSISNVGSGSGGNVTFVSAPTSGKVVRFVREMPYDREVDYQTSGDLLADTLDNDLDRLECQIQQLGYAIDRAMSYPNSDSSSVTGVLPSATDRAEKVLYFDSTGKPTAVSISVFNNIIAGANYVVDAFTGDGVTKNFVLSIAPGTRSNTDVHIDGVYQNKEGYALTDTVLTFSEAPYSGADIEVVSGDAIPEGFEGNATAVRYVPSGTGAVETNVAAKLSESVSVKDFGAVGDGVTDDTAAIAAAIQYVTTPVNSIYCRGLYWPDGQYLVTQNNWIGENLSVAGVYGGRLDTIFQGSGRNSAVIIFKPTVADAACYDQTLTPTALLNGFKVQNLGFKFDNTANGSQPIHFIRSKAEPSMASQNWRLNDTKFIGVTGSRLFWLQGSVNEDVISVYDTTTNTFENIVYAESNLEALMHSFYSLDCLNQLGSIFKYNKGGALQVDTLNAIMTGTNGVDTGVFELLDGTTTRIYTFNNVRCELRGANTRLLLVPVTSANTIAFKNCEVAAVINSQAWAKVIVQSHCTISFKDCIFPRPDYTVTGALGTKGTLQLTDSTSGSDYTITDASRSYIIFENCSYTGDRLAAVDPWVDFTLLDPAYVNFRSVQVSYRGCTNIPDMVEYGFPYRQSRSYVTEAPAKMIMRGDTFPQGDGVSAPLTRTGDFNVVIPLNNFVTEIVVMRKALTTAATNYQIEFIDQAERDAPGTGVIFGTTTAVPNNTAIAQRVPILRLFNGTKAQRTIWARMAAGFTLGASVGTPSDGGIYVEVL